MSGKKSFLIVAFALLAAVRLTGECSPTVVVQVPPGACKSGTATVAVAALPGSTFAWIVDGGVIAGDATSDHITIALGTKDKVTASVTVTADGCTSHGDGVIALHDPFAVRASIPPAGLGQSLTIVWDYDNGSPSTQTISGSDFGAVTLPSAARSFTYTPARSGSKQFVIDAVMLTPLPSPIPASIRRRSVAKSPATASACPTVLHTTAPYTVDECLKPSVILDAPSTIVSGTNFQLSVVPQAGAVATWTIFNGSPATATGDSVMVTAGSAGTVEISVRVSRGSCADQADRSIAIIAKPVCSDPKVVVTAGPVSCGTAIVNATFTGTPPFHGMWSDNVPFTAEGMSIARTVTMPGNYSIVTFEDAACAGTASGVAVLPSLHPTATISGKANGCAGVDSVTMRFTGKPPFWGVWSDGSEFQTNEMEIVKPITAAGLLTLAYGYDATECRLDVNGGVQGRSTPKIFKMEQFCEGPDFDNVSLVGATFLGDVASPVTVNWSDGETTTQNGSPVWRVIQPQTTDKTYSVVSAHDAYCSAVFEGPTSITVHASVIPDFQLGIGNLCAGATATASLATPPPPDAQVHWYGENATIVSGQGTSSIQYKAGEIGQMLLGCTFTFTDPERCPTSHRQVVVLNAPPNATMTVSPQQIQAGKTAVITFTASKDVHYWTFDNSLNDSIVLTGTCGSGSPCEALYTSSHGPGKSTITLHATGFCPETKDVSVELNIVP